MSTHEAIVTLGALGKQKVRFEFEPECLGHGSHPDESAYVYITDVCITGIWIEATELLAAQVLSIAEQELLESQAQRLQEDRNEAAWEREQERRMEEGYP